VCPCTPCALPSTWYTPTQMADAGLATETLPDAVVSCSVYLTAIHQRSVVVCTQGSVCYRALVLARVAEQCSAAVWPHSLLARAHRIASSRICEDRCCATYRLGESAQLSLNNSPVYMDARGSRRSADSDKLVQTPDSHKTLMHARFFAGASTLLTETNQLRRCRPLRHMRALSSMHVPFLVNCFS